MENIKLKNLLKKLFENKEFEMTITDEDSLWDEDERGWTDVEITYNFKFHVVVLNVIGEGLYAVGEIDVIIDDITKDGRDFYSDWVDRNYSSGTWYIEELKDKFYYEFFENIPFNIQSGFYGHDEKRYNEYLTQESVIKRIVREDQHNSVKINMGNDKLKNLLKKLFENKEFEMTLTDTKDFYDGYNNVTQDIIFEFKFHVVVRSVVGEGTRAVGDMDIIIDSITKNGEDNYRIWAGNGYNNAVWYIRELDETFYLDYLEVLPFSVYSTVYGHDEKRDDDTIQESVIKRIVKETVMDKFIIMKYIITEEQSEAVKKIKVMEKYVDSILSDNDWYEGIDSVKVEEFRLSRNDKKSIPLYVFYVTTNDYEKSYYEFNTNKSEYNEIDVMFESLFPYDKSGYPSAVWVVRWVML